MYKTSHLYTPVAGFPGVSEYTLLKENAKAQGGINFFDQIKLLIEAGNIKREKLETYMYQMYQMKNSAWN